MCRCVKDNDGKIVVEVDTLMEVWSRRFNKLSNEKLIWDRERLADERSVCGLSERALAAEVDAER